MLKTTTEFASEKKGHTYVQWMVGLVANSLLLSYGMQVGWVVPSARALQAPRSPAGAPLSDAALGWVASAVPISALLCVPVYGYLPDKIGRKRTLLLMTLPQAAVWILKLFPNMTCLMIARICAGMGAAGGYIVVPMYNKEISQLHNRGALGSLIIVFYNLGLLIMYAIGAYFDYYTVLYMSIVMPILSFVLLLMCPESPGFLVKIGKTEEAAKALSMLRGLDAEDKEIQTEVDQMRKHAEYYNSLPSLTIPVILKNRAWRKGVILTAILSGVQSSSGNFTLTSFGAKILAATGAGNEQLQVLSFPAVMMAASLVSMCLVERIGRRVILLVSYLVSAASLGCLALLLQWPGAAPAWAPLAAITLSMLAYAGGVLPVPYIVMSEVFNIQIRAKLMSATVAGAWSLSFVQVSAFAPASAALGAHACFYGFAAVHLLGVAAVLLLMPETRGKSIDEIEAELRS